MVKRKSPLEPTPSRKRAYEIPNLVNIQAPQDPIRQIENEAIRDLSNEYRQLRIEEMIAKKKKQLTASGSPSNIQAQRENLEYFKTVMELSKMTQPKDQPDRPLEYLKFFNTVTQNQGAPANFFDQYIKGRELGIFGQPSTGDSNTSDVEIEKLRGERMLDSKRIDLELHKLRLERESDQGKIGMVGSLIAPFLAYSGAKVAEDMKAKGADMANRYRNPGNSQNALNEFLTDQGIIRPDSLQGPTGEMQIACDCGFNKSMIVPVPPPPSISCPNCGKALQTGPAPSGDAEVSQQWEKTM